VSSSDKRDGNGRLEEASRCVSGKEITVKSGLDIGNLNGWSSRSVSDVRQTLDPGENQLMLVRPW
jgi:hypothetical protein